MSDSSPNKPELGPDGAPLPAFGVNEMRLGAGQWVAVALLFAAIVLGVPRCWKRVERFDTGPDYRVPYSLSRDYWLYSRRLEQVADPKALVVLGDSVVWGEYVLPDGTLSHFLDREAGATNRFVNAGVNGLFPLAMEGLVRHYGQAIGPRKVIVQCNLLWMTSPKADLSAVKEESFNHARLVPQFRPRIPCYRADTSERLGICVEHEFGFLQWAGHLENVYFAQKGIPQWTLADDGNDPPGYPNLYRNPLSQITLSVPTPFGGDPDRGPASPRHRAWDRSGARPADFEWVDGAVSLQWGAFQRVVECLRGRGAEVLVVVGPFNESMVAASSREKFLQLRGQVVAWLGANKVPHVVPDALPSELYADASHPLTEGYAMLARRLWQDPGFQGFLTQRNP